MSCALAEPPEELLDHVDPDSYELSHDGFYDPLICALSADGVKVQLTIATPFPNIKHFAIRAFLGGDEILQVLPETDPPPPSPYFWLILRIHSHPIESLRDYLMAEFRAYDDLGLQNSQLAPIGFASRNSETVTVFFAVAVQTAESQKDIIAGEDISTKLTWISRLVSLLEQAHSKNVVGFDLRPGNLLVNQTDLGTLLLIFGFVGDSQVLELHPDKAALQWPSQAPPELKKQPRRRSKNATVLAPTKASDVFWMGSLVQIFLGDFPQTASIVLKAMDANADDRITMEQFKLQFRDIADDILKNFSKSSSFPRPPQSPDSARPNESASRQSPAIPQPSPASLPSPRRQANSAISLLHRTGYPEPIGWIDDFEQEDSAFSLIRAEILITAPDGYESATLSIVDPSHTDGEGFRFVRISGAVHEGRAIFISIPQFAIARGSSDIQYCIRHENLVWKHDAKPLNCGRMLQPSVDAVAHPVYEMTLEVGTSDYVQSRLPFPKSAEYYIALEYSKPPVPESIMQQGHRTIQGLPTDELVALAVAHPHRKVASFAIDILMNRRVSLGSLVKMLYSRYNDTHPQEAISVMSQFVQREESSTPIRSQLEAGRTTSDIGVTPRGFLCDQPDLFKEQLSPSQLFQQVAQMVPEVPSMFFAEAILKRNDFKTKNPNFVLTKESKTRLAILCYALEAGIPLMIQGPTSAAKSMTAYVASMMMFDSAPLVYALSDQTEVGDLLGRKLLRRNGTALLTFVPGVLTQAYRDGRVLLLDEFDLCPPKIIASILSALDGTTIEINGEQIHRHNNFRLIATLNGETSGFTSDQRNVLPSDILSRFQTVAFDGISRTECNRIFEALAPKKVSWRRDTSQQIADLHKAIQEHFSDANPNQRDLTRGEAIMTLRNFNAVIALEKFGGLMPRAACAVAYLAQLPLKERNLFSKRMSLFDEDSSIEAVSQMLKKKASKMDIHPHPQFVDAAAYAYMAARSGLHVLLAGPSGSGLTTIAKFVAHICIEEGERSQRSGIPYILLGSESTVDNIIGSFKPQSLSEDEHDITKLISWENGPLLEAALEGIPVILDRIEEAKSQVTERVNPILEQNARNETGSFIVPERGESTIQHMRPGFIVIATLTTDTDRQTAAISLALRNRFVTIAVEHPAISDPLAESISSTTLTKLARRVSGLEKGSRPPWAIPSGLSEAEINDLSRNVARHVGIMGRWTVRDVALLADAAGSLVGVVQSPNSNVRVKTSQLDAESLKDDSVETLVHRTLNQDGHQRFFYQGDRDSPMWQLIAALAVCSATGSPLFLQGPPGCGKTEAVRHFSGYRVFNSQTPVYSVSCSSETSIEQFFGCQVFGKDGFRFVEGPLVQAARSGYVFLADEFNLLTPNVLTALIPFLEARSGDKLKHTDIRDPISISPGFVFVATGNDTRERGRVQLPSFVSSQFRVLNVSNPTSIHIEHLIQKIIDADYPRVRLLSLTSFQIRKLIDELREITHIVWSLRSVRRFLRRLNDFVGYQVSERAAPFFHDISEITATDVALSFILSRSPMSGDSVKKIVDRIVGLLGGSESAALTFAQAHTGYRHFHGTHYLIRGHVALIIDKPADFPEPMLDTLFWARWTGTPADQSPKESLLLVGPTNYKGSLLRFLLPNTTSVYDMTRETQMSELIGSTKLSSIYRIRDDTQQILDLVRYTLDQRCDINSFMTATELEVEYRQALDLVKYSAGGIDRNPPLEARVGVLRGSWFIMSCLEKWISENEGTEGRIAQRGASIPVVMCFVPSVVTRSVLLGTPLILKSIHLPPPSVLERLNSLLEDPRSLVLGEDTQRIFSNPIIIERITGSTSRSIPVCCGFSISATTTESGFLGLSCPLQSRFTYIAATPYCMSIEHPIGSSSGSDLQKISETILGDQYDLISEIHNIYSDLQRIGRAKITITEYVRWCRSAGALVSDARISREHAVGVAALRTIVDAMNVLDRRRLTKEVLRPHIPVPLACVVVSDSQNIAVMDRPIGFVDEAGRLQMRTNLSGITLPTLRQVSSDILSSILWTQSSVDMADAVLTSVGSNAITIFEGSPGRGKTAVASAVLQALGLECIRVNISPMTSAEDLFGRDIPQSAQEGGFTTRFVDGPLTAAMHRSQSDSRDQAIPSQAILLDEINLASPQLLERMESFMLNMVTADCYLLPNGKSVDHLPIVIVATMNSAALSNARSTLSTKLQGASHFLRLVPFTTFELEALADAILAEPGQRHCAPDMLQKVMKAHTLVGSVLERESGIASERDSVTLRELLRLRQFHHACPAFEPEVLIELVYATQFGSIVANELLTGIGLTSRFNVTKPLIRHKHLLFNDEVSLPLLKDSPDGPANLPLTTEQCRVGCLIGAGVMAKRPVAIFGESGSGKTHIVRTLAQAVGMPLGVIQFDTDTDSAAIIGSLEIDGNMEDMKRIRLDMTQLARRLIFHEHPLCLAFAFFAFSEDSDLQPGRDILDQLTCQLSNSPLDPGLASSAKELSATITDFMAQSVQNFVFREGPLLKMMRGGNQDRGGRDTNGGWILLDGVDAAPQEVERLMSLLEEDPTFSIYEGVRPLFFHTRDSLTSTGPASRDLDDAEHIEIAAHFQIFITCRDPRLLSPALRSRCFCLHLESAQDEKSLAELTRCILSQSLTVSSYSTPFSESLTKAFISARHLALRSPLLFSKDVIGPHKLVNCARGLSNCSLTPQSVVECVRMSFISCFRNSNDRRQMIAEIRDVFSAIAKRRISISQSGWEELNMLAGRLEYAAVRTAFTGSNWLDKANLELDAMFHSQYGEETRILKFHNEPEKLIVQELLMHFEDNLLDWIGNMTVGDIQKTVTMLNELIFVVASFVELSDLPGLFRILIFVTFMRPASYLSKLEVGQGEVLCQKKIEKSGFSGFASGSRTPENSACLIASIQHIHSNIRTVLPDGISFEMIFAGVLSTILLRFYSDPVYGLCHSQTVLPLVGIQALTEILQHIELIGHGEVPEGVLRTLAQSGRQIIVAHADDEEDSSKIYIVLSQSALPVIRHQSKEFPATTEGIASLLGEGRIPTKPWAHVTLRSSMDGDIDGLATIPGLSHGQRLWWLSYYFAGVPANLLTPNQYLCELIRALRDYPERAVQCNLLPTGSYLTILRPATAEITYQVVEFLSRMTDLNHQELVKTLQKERNFPKDLLVQLSKYKRCVSDVLDVFDKVKLKLWQNVIPKLQEMQTLVREIDEREKLDAQNKAVHKKFQSAIDDLSATVSKGSLLFREVELAVSFFTNEFQTGKLPGPSDIEHTLAAIEAYRKYLVEKRDAKPISPISPGIVQTTGYCSDPSIPRGIMALARYTLAEHAIHEAVADPAFGNVIHVLFILALGENDKSCLAPFYHLLGPSISRRKLSTADITQLHLLNRVHLLHATTFRETQKCHCFDLLRRLVAGDEVVAYHLQQSDLQGLSHIQFPSFHPSDLVACIKYSTGSGVFSGPFAPSGDLNDLSSPRAETIQAALAECAKVLGASEAQDRISGREDMDTWLTEEDDPVLPQLLQIGREFQSLECPEWLFSPDGSPAELKQALACRPYEAMTAKNFPNEFRAALNSKEEWDSARRLSVLFVLLRARASQEGKTPKRPELEDPWSERWMFEIHARSQADHLFGYRISILLGCDFINDIEAVMARQMFTQFLSYDSRFHQILHESKLGIMIFDQMTRYLDCVLDNESVPIDKYPIMDMQSFLAGLLHDYLCRVVDREKQKRLEICHRMQNSLACALQEMLHDISHCFADEKEAIKNIRENGGQLVAKIRSGLSEAAEVAENLCFEQWRLSWWLWTVHVPILGNDRVLDKYFALGRGPSLQLFQAAEALCSAYRPDKPVEFQAALNFVAQEFPAVVSASCHPSFEMALEVKKHRIQDLCRAIKFMIPFFRSVSPPCSLPPPREVHAAAAWPHDPRMDFNILVGDHLGQLAFLVPAFTADFGTNIDRACLSRCGAVIIENLSSNSVNVELRVEKQASLLARLKSATVGNGANIEIEFSVDTTPTPVPVMASLIAVIIAKSTVEPHISATTSLIAFVRRCPSCAIIDSSVNLITHETSCTLASPGDTAFVKLAHRLPNIPLSSRPMAFALASRAGNEVESPMGGFDKNSKELELQFSTSVTGRCIGDIIVFLGKTRLYTLHLNVLVEKDSDLAVYHPAALDRSSITISDSNITYLAVKNDGEQKRSVKLTCSLRKDKLEPSNFDLGPGGLQWVKVTFSEPGKRSIGIKYSSARFDIDVTPDSPKFQGTEFITPVHSFVNACVLVPGRAPEVRYLTTEQFCGTDIITIVTEKSAYRYRAKYQNSHGLHMIGLDSTKGLVAFEPEVSIPPEVLVLWAEDHSGPSVAIRPMLSVNDEAIDMAMAAVDKIANRVNTEQDEVLGTLLAEANRMADVPRFSNFEQMGIVASAKNVPNSFGRLLVALNTECRRTSSPAEKVTQLILERLREGSAPDISAAPNPWARSNQFPSKQNGLKLIWYTIILLRMLTDPYYITRDELKRHRTKLVGKPPIRAELKRPSRLRKKEPEQPFIGEDVKCIGVVAGVFTDRTVVEKIFDDLKALPIPSVPDDTRVCAADTSFPIRQLVAMVTNKIEVEIENFLSAKNPRELFDVLVQMPFLASQIALAVRHSAKSEVTHLLSRFTLATQILLQLHESQENMQLLSIQIDEALRSCALNWQAIETTGIQIPPFPKWTQLSSSLAPPSPPRRIQNVLLEPFPDGEPINYQWVTPAARASRSSITTAFLGLGTHQIQRLSLGGLGAFDVPDTPQTPNAAVPLIPPPIARPTFSLAQPSKGVMSIEQMQLAIQNTVIADLSDAPIDPHDFIPCKGGIDAVESRQVSVDIAKLMEGRSVEDLLENEWRQVSRRFPGKDGRLRISEGRVVHVIEGWMDPLTDIESASCPELMHLQRISLHIQSLMYGTIANYLSPHVGDVAAPTTICNTEVAILIDVSASMTTLSRLKLICAEALATGIVSVLSAFGVPIRQYAFADREAIWGLSDPQAPDPMTDLFRVIDALRSGGRPGSCPLDAILTAESDWVARRKMAGDKVADSHCTLVISDFISAQALDQNRVWSDYTLGKCLLLSLDTMFKSDVLEQKNIPRQVYESGLLPRFDPEGLIKAFRINPVQICTGHAADSSPLQNVMTEFIKSLATKTGSPSQTTSPSLTSRPPVLNSTSIWAQLCCHQKDDSGDEQEIFFQAQQSQGFALITMRSNAEEGKVRVDEYVGTDRRWLDRKGGSPPQERTPYDGYANDIATMALTHSLIPNVAAEKEPSATSGELWIDGLRRFIASGYTFQYLFRKKTRRNQKNYSITVVVDNVQRLFSPFNASHTLFTISSLLGSLPRVPDSDGITFDVIASSSGHVALLLAETRVCQLFDRSLIGDLLRTLERTAGTASGVGLGCQAALQTAARRYGIDHSRRIIVLTDSIVTSPSEVMALRSALIECEGSGIDVLGVGLGIAPLHLHELFPVCLYAPKPSDLGSAMAAALRISSKTSAPKILPRQLFYEFQPTRLAEIADSLATAPLDRRFCPGLIQSIRDHPISMDFLEGVGNTDLLFMKGQAGSLMENPEEEPWHDGVFEGFKILIICLYMGKREKNNRITQSVFDEQCGSVLRRKGFSYTFCCSYGEGIDELIRDDDGRCPYNQLWLFSSDGYGTLPDEARDKDSNKILPFMKVVTEFWTKGGGLLLFCDNAPYTFDANYLLENFIRFDYEGQRYSTAVRFGGIQAGKGQYEGYEGKKQILVAPSDCPQIQSFCRQTDLPAPGQASHRVSLRPGLLRFYEGNTISYAVDKDKKPLTTPDELWPFTPFAWTSEPVDPPRPFILFYDPKITSDDMNSPGPIVVHGGFTSAFYEFGEDELGTGRLVVSISCWLTRIEERLHLIKRTAAPLLTTIPRLVESYTGLPAAFTKWLTPPLRPRHSILVLDGSGSMSAVYRDLVMAANKHIVIIAQNGGICSVVRFSSQAKVIYLQGNRPLVPEEIYDAGSTDFTAALQVTIPLATSNPQGYECRILFFTDGEPNATSRGENEVRLLAKMGVRMDVVGFGNVNHKTLNGMATCGGKVTYGQTVEDLTTIFVVAATE